MSKRAPICSGVRPFSMSNFINGIISNPFFLIPLGYMMEPISSCHMSN
ncbi:DUF3955 domain-containing protein [Limosilactobacillus fermentum]|nr:DUF3955 domain-containing protein [Limosilactobacillus fermentum]